MAVLQFKRGLKADLSKAPISDGNFYITTDEGAIYIDINDSARIRIGNFEEYEHAATIESIARPNRQTLYYASDTNGLYAYNSTVD